MPRKENEQIVARENAIELLNIPHVKLAHDTVGYKIKIDRLAVAFLKLLRHSSFSGSDPDPKVPEVDNIKGDKQEKDKPPK